MKYILKFSSKTKAELERDQIKDPMTYPIKVKMIKYTSRKKDEMDLTMPNGQILRMTKDVREYLKAFRDYVKSQDLA